VVVLGFRDDWGVQGRSDDQRELLDAESVAGHLLKSDSVFAFLAAHRSELFPEAMFADLFPSRRGRPTDNVIRLDMIELRIRSIAR
jgi:hypothetical protein